LDPYVVGISGASGMVLARRAIDLLTERGYPVVVTVSQNARMVWRQEADESFDLALERWTRRGVRFFQPLDLAAPIASGSYPVAGMLVIPCSMGTVAGISAGLSTNLLQRAADCAIKEGRRLVLVPRESPLSAIHLENLLKLARIGVRIVLPVPAFYTQPRTLDDVIDQIARRSLDALGVPGILDSRFIYTGLDGQSTDSGPESGPTP
jgi:4-hydroxy-3-polyprenylbenzoate decarboxylase